MRKKIILAVLLILGIADASYLTVVHFLPRALECPSIGTTVNCEDVLGSVYSTVFGIPLAAIGLVWFVASLIFLLLGYNRIIKNIWMLFGIGGIIYSATTQSILGKICIYCTTLDVLILLSVYMFLMVKDLE
ncbi:MAG: vitamin K epoxide reductase family protein [Candidatus Micrarchaeota archaeon]|nr:vitamin K epoxide reductase family protein [Candidatus Micrarchaeota archaeon]